jgi:ACS family glucarate transporter-like MFS transporter
MTPSILRRVRVRWWMLIFMFTFALMSFVQRTSVMVAADTFMPILHLSQVRLGWLNTAFFATYAAMQIPGGAFGQIFGARRTYVLVGILSLAATLAMPLLSLAVTGTALFASLLLAQLVLGVALAPVFPVFASVVEAWFPTRQWAIANGLQTAGMVIGGAVTPLVVVALTESFGWRTALVLATLPVAFLTVGWGRYGRNLPRQHPRVTAAELAELDSRADTPRLSWRRLGQLAANRDVLVLAFSYLCMNYAFYLLTYWSFLYLVQVRHFKGIESGIAGMLPWIGAAAGAAAGGFICDRCVQRWGPRRGYRLVPLVCLPLAGALLLVTVQVDHAYGAVASLALAFAAVEINEGPYWATTMVAAGTDAGAATGILNTGGNLGGILCQPLVAALSASGHWDAAFETGTVFALVAAAAWLLVNAERTPR